MLKNISGVLKI